METEYGEGHERLGSAGPTMRCPDVSSFSGPHVQPPGGGVGVNWEPECSSGTPVFSKDILRIFLELLLWDSWLN